MLSVFFSDVKVSRADFHAWWQIRVHNQPQILGSSKQSNCQPWTTSPTCLTGYWRKRLTTKASSRLYMLKLKTNFLNLTYSDICVTSPSLHRVLGLGLSSLIWVFYQTCGSHYSTRAESSHGAHCIYWSILSLWYCLHARGSILGSIYNSKTNSYSPFLWRLHLDHLALCWSGIVWLHPFCACLFAFWHHMLSWTE